MSGVLAFLAARSLTGAPSVAEDGTPAPALRPRVPALYETPADSTADFPIEEIAEEAAPASRPRGATASPVPPTTIEPARPEIPAPEPRRAAMPRPVAREDAHSPVPTPHTPSAAPPIESRPDAPLETPPRLERMAEPAPHRTEQVSPPPVPAPIMQAPAPSEVPKQQTQATAANQRIVESAASPQRVSQPPPLAPPPLAPPAPLLAPLPPPVRAPAVAMPRAPEAAPRVQVTIGRLEIRATSAPPAPEKRPAPRQKSMSLDEYLARRGAH